MFVRVCTVCVYVMSVLVNVSAYLFMPAEERNINYKIQTHKRFKGTLFIRTQKQSANFGGVILWG